jgi:drug/metabolite transporter (DMT)-like permease
MSASHKESLGTSLLTVLAVVSFAANSILCRMALGEATLDPISFTSIRLVSGAAALVLVNAALAPRRSWRQGDFYSASMLFLYAIAFSLAYVRLPAATGALILFGAVQLTMFSAAVKSGERPSLRQWLGVFMALGGLVWLLSPGLSAPPPLGAGLMGLAGLCWGIYSLRGANRGDPLAVTTDNFLRSVPFILVVSLAMLRGAHISPYGAVLAASSGALASGVGYAIWYAALRRITKTEAALVQLCVPVIASLGGVMFLAEAISARWFGAALLILSGVGVGVTGQRDRLPAGDTGRRQTADVVFGSRS